MANSSELYPSIYLLLHHVLLAKVLNSKILRKIFLLVITTKIIYRDVSGDCRRANISPTPIGTNSVMNETGKIRKNNMSLSQSAVKLIGFIRRE